MAFTIPNEADAFHQDQAEPDKVDVDILVSGVSGDGVLSGCAVTQRGAGANMSVDVASGTVLIGGTSASVTGANVAVTAADGTNPRFDLVEVTNAGALSVKAGTPASNPVFPSVTSGRIAIAAIYVPAGDTAIATNQITDKRVIVKQNYHSADNSLIPDNDSNQVLGDSSHRLSTVVSNSFAVYETLGGDLTAQLSNGELLLDGPGSATEFLIRASGNGVASIPTGSKLQQIDAPTVSTDLCNKAYVDDLSPLTTKGDLWTYTSADARLGVGANDQALFAASGQATGLQWAAITEAKLSISDNTTNDVSTTKHGFTPKAPNDTTKFLRGDATWAVPTGGADVGGRFTHNANQSIAHNTSTVVALNTETYKTSGITHSNVTNNSRVTMDSAGKYLFTANVSWGANATGFRALVFKINGTTYVGIARMMAITTASEQSYQMAVTEWNASAGDYVEIEVFQNSGSSINIETGSSYSPVLTVRKVDKGG